ncbi:alpha/beta hydrolase [Micrococcaceae bacterium Sec5.7]
MITTANTESPVVLVPGYWLGSWAWETVSEHLRHKGHQTYPITLPGLESPATERAGMRFADHVSAVSACVRAVGDAVVLVAHSGAGAVVTAVLDAVPHLVSRVIYLDSGPASQGAVPRPDVGPDVVELPLPPFAELEASGASLDGLDGATLQRFRDNAVPHPAGAVREPIQLVNPARHAVPATIICCSFPSTTVKELVASGDPMFAAIAELRDVTYLDLPTGHWPMWSHPAETADVLSRAARDRTRLI